MDENIPTFYLDSDGDGFGSDTEIQFFCQLDFANSGSNYSYVGNNQDCDDTEFTISPNGSENFTDGIDNDCDELMNQLDDELDIDSLFIFYADDDNDGYGDAGEMELLCSVQEGYIDNADDCDDNDPLSTHISIDMNCDTILNENDFDSNGDELCDETLLLISSDADCDGVITELDCDDNDPLTVNDMDCDGVLETDDCDDENPNASYTENDADCDGVITELDCNDNNQLASKSNFVLEDVNTYSDSTSSLHLCDYFDQVSGWYFLHGT